MYRYIYFLTRLQCLRADILLFFEMPQITQVSVITTKSSIKKLSQKLTGQLW